MNAKRMQAAPGSPDRENPEWTAQDFQEAVPLKEGHPALYEHLKAAQARTRGKQKTPTKEQISLRLTRGTLERFRATGAGWQRRIDEALAEAAKKL